jgi:acyl-CoA thioesterase FadM
MHMIWRTLWIFIKKRFMQKSNINDVTEYTMRVLPTDLDLLMHVNNGIYFSLMDFGRWDMVFRNGVYDACYTKGWYAVVAGETIKFRKSLELWDKFTLQTKIVGHDDKNFFVQQKFICKGQLMATGLVKVRFLKKKGGTVSPEEIFAQTNERLETKATDLSGEWLAIESKYMT